MKKITALILILCLIPAVPVFAEADTPPLDGATAGYAGSAAGGENYHYILPMEYRRIEREKHCIVAYDMNDKAAIYDLNGRKLSENYDTIDSFNDSDAALAMRDGTSYIINCKGEVLSSFDKRVMDVTDYVLVNETETNNDDRPSHYFEGEFGVYTLGGKLIKTLPYEKFLPYRNSGYNLTFAGGRMIFEENDKFGAIDENFEVVIPPEYDKIYPFYDDAPVTVAIKDGKYGIIDKNGNTAADFVYDEITPNFKSEKTNAYKVKQGEAYGILDEFGKVLLPLCGKEICALYGEYGLAEFGVPNTREDNDEYPYLYGLIDLDGNEIIPAEHIFVWDINDGIICAQKAYDQNGYYDLKGNPITEFKYRMASRFSEGLAFTASCTDDVWTYEVINTKGEVVLNPPGFAGGFFGGIAHAEQSRIMDKTGKVVIENPEWEVISGLDWWSSKGDGVFYVSNGGKTGLVMYDAPSDWATEHINSAIALGIVPAELQNRYRENITRENFCNLAYNLPGVQTAVANSNITPVSFNDTDNERVAALCGLGIIKGVGDNNFAPNSSITREAAAVILARLSDIVYNIPHNEVYFEFADSGDISDWAADGVQTICNLGIMEGVGNSEFAPKGTYTTEQAITTMLRLNNKSE